MKPKNSSRLSTPTQRPRLRPAQALACAFLFLTAPGQSPANAASGGALNAASGALKPEAIGAIYAQIEQSEYEIHWQQEFGAFMAPNRSHNLRITLRDDGFTVTPRKPLAAQTPWAATLHLGSYGREGPLGRRVGTVSWATAKNTAEVRGDGVMISYKNDKQGLRQNFLIQERPPGAGPLRLDFLVERTGLNIEVDREQNALYFMAGDDMKKVMMRYRDLNVFDANQKSLAAQMVQTDADRFAIVVEDQEAAYPVLVDPGLESDGYVDDSGGHLFGWSVAYILYYEDPPNVGGASIGGILVGAPHFDPGSYSDAGEVCFFDTNLSKSPPWSYAGTKANELVGWSVADGGVNISVAEYGGQHHNILVGAPGYSTSGPHAQTNEGAAFAFYPTNTGYPFYGSSPSWSVTGLVSNANFGWSVAGDVDFLNNGISSVIVGAPNYPEPQARPEGGGSSGPIGEVCVYYGNGSGYDTTVDWTAEGTANSLFGFSVEWGRVAGGYYPAVLVGAPGVSSSTGAVYEFLFDTSTELPDSTPDATLSGQNSGDEFGYSLASRQSQQNNSYQDLLVGAPYATSNSMAGAGIVYLFLGGYGGLSGTPAWGCGGKCTNANCGTSVALGDMNGDGYADVMVGEPNFSGTNFSGDELIQNGRADLYLTDTSTLLPTNTAFIENYNTSYANLGNSVSYGYPWTFHYYADIIVGLPNDTGGTVGVGLWHWSP